MTREKSNIPLSDSIIKRIKNNKFAATVIVAATIVTPAIVFWEKVYGIYETQFRPQVTLVAMNLDETDAAHFSDSKSGTPCLREGPSLRSFEPRGDRAVSSALTLVFTFTNRGRTDAIFTGVDFVVDHVQRVAGGSPGAVVPNVTYRMDLELAKGVQSLRLIPVYRIPSNDTGAFKVVMTPKVEAIGQCWILKLVFKTNQRDIATEDFAMLLSKETPRR
jgi:hypothetical protein